MTKNISTRRLFSLLLIFVILAGVLPLGTTPTYAATKISLENTTYDRPDPSKFYTKYYYKNDEGNWTWKWSKAVTEGKMHKYVLNRTSDTAQKWAYCIEPDKEMATSYEIEDTDSNDYWNALNSSQRMGVSLVLKFGLQHNKFPAYGYTSKESTAAYIATQCLVWEFKEGVRTTSDFSRNTVTNSAGETRVPASTYYNVVKQNDTCLEIYNSILSAVKKYYNGASFTRKSSADAKEAPIVLKWDPKTEQYSAIVTDSNSCGLYGSDIAEALGENYKVSRSGNKYTITKLTTAAATKTVKLESYGSDMLEGRGGEVQKVWTNTLKQPLMTGSSHPVNLYLTVTTEDTGWLNITKKVSGEPASTTIDYTKFKFTIKNSSGSTVYTGYPDVKGNLKVRLATGKYTLSEELTATQKKTYVQPADQTVTVTTSHTSTAPIVKTFTNGWKKGSIEIVKTADDNDLIGLQFKITGPGGYSKTVTIAESNLNAAKTQATLVVGNLPVGTYTVTELTPSKYDEQEPQSVNLVMSDENPKATVSFHNTTKTVLPKIRVVKQDVSNTKTVKKAGFTFTIYDNQTKKYLINPKTGDKNFVTDTTGYTPTVGVEHAGTYVIKETAVPAGSGYMLDAAERTITVQEQTGTSSTISYYMRDTAKKVKLQIVKEGAVFSKVSETNGEMQPVFVNKGLAGAEFTITSVNDIMDNTGEVIYAAGEQVAKVTTDANGKAISGELFPGKYLVKEVKAPAGYLIDEVNGRTVTLNASDENVKVVTYTQTFKDSNDFGKVRVIKKDIETDEPVNGATYGIFKSATTIDKQHAYMTVKTKNGEAVFDKLEKGKYYVKELAAPEGYSLNEDLYVVNVNDTSSEVIVKTYDHKAFGDVTIMKYLEDGKTPLKGVTFEIFSDNGITRTATTGDDGKIVFKDLPVGTYTLIEENCEKYELSEFVDLAKAVMMQESGGEGTDPMQASECGYNEKYPKEPGGIKDPAYSVAYGVQYLKSCLDAAEVNGPLDMDHIKLALQGYNYGKGYITWAVDTYGGYSKANAVEYGELMANKNGWKSYGDKDYVEHVLRYYPYGNYSYDIENTGPGRLGLPIKGMGLENITSHFGPRISPGGIGSTEHDGIDIGFPEGTHVLACESGEVTFSGWNGGYGKCIKISHIGDLNGDGATVEIIYAHLSEIKVRVGQKVVRGQYIGEVGNTGNSTGPHLHMGVLVDGEFVNPERGWVRLE